MEGICTLEAPRQRAHRGYALIEVLYGLATAALRTMARGIAGFVRARRMARLRTEMHGMSDRHLRDIGLERHQIDCLFR
jgi:uncharacterized protein YjiS (DUF1127 family)